MNDPRIAYMIRRTDDVLVGEDARQAGAKLRRLREIRTDEPLWGADSLAVREALANLPASQQKGTDR